MADKKIKDFKTDAFVLRRTNYREADRILTIISPIGQKSVIAKGVRKEKSKLAGAVEPFSLTEMNLHEGKSELLTLTGARCKKFYGEILKDFSRLEVASEIMKKVIRATSSIDSPEYFELVRQCFEALEARGDNNVILTWFYLNLARTNGEEINLHFDTDGKILSEYERYVWDSTELALKPEPKGRIGVNEIKMLRLMLAAKLGLVLRVKEAKEMTEELLFVAKTLNQL